LGYSTDSLEQADLTEKANQLYMTIQERESKPRKPDLTLSPDHGEKLKKSGGPMQQSKNQAELEIWKKQNADLEILVSSYKADLKQKTEDNKELTNILVKKDAEVNKCSNRLIMF